MKRPSQPPEVDERTSTRAAVSGSAAGSAGSGSNAGSATGVTGTAGSFAGSAGLTGSAGNAGSASGDIVVTSGSTGLTGSAGNAGSATGITGTSGSFTGSAGVAGAAGNAGSATGITGTSGSFTGSAGVAGAAGNAGSATGITGTSGSFTGTTSGTGVTCAGIPSNEDLIDNMNDGSQIIPSINGRAGAWQVYHDTTPGAMMFPADGTFPMSDTGNSCLLLAARAYGGPFVLWGAGFSVGLGSPYDATAYAGITFLARIGAGSTSVVRVAFPDKDTDPSGNRCSTVAGSATACFDHFGERITLSTTWTTVTIAFSDLTQDGFGNVVSQFDPSTLYSIQWNLDAGATFDVWIDNLALLRHP